MKTITFIYLLLIPYFLFSQRNIERELQQAIKENNIEKVGSLLKENKNIVNSVFPSQETPLHVASEYGHAEIIKILLQSGADIHAVNANNFNCLVFATRKNHVEAFKLLAENGANINAEDINGSSVLEWSGDIQIVKYLVSKGVNYKKDGYSDLWAAVIKGDKGAVKKLFERRSREQHFWKVLAAGFPIGPQNSSGFHSMPLNFILVGKGNRITIRVNDRP